MKKARILQHLLQALVSIWIVCFVVFGLKERFSELHAIILIVSSIICFVCQMIVENNHIKQREK